ncbi:MAG: hypothetical protein IPK14_02555 [Blastocatellia bacterium]|nr:hypothetical protein [Blastocatellia bacterium]MBL8196592.1 hypothetical protein [Blastocatellia bacterium]MBN8724740.1 hypothetical protein [Acidobacteriota bacterium]
MKNTSIKRNARNAVTSVKNYFSFYPPSPIIYSIAAKKVLELNLLVVNNSYWQTADYKELLASYLETTERILNIKIKIIEEKICDINDKIFNIGNWDGLRNYTKEIVDIINKYGSKDRLTLLLCNEIENAQALAVLKSWSGEKDGLEKEAIILSSKSTDNALSQLLARIFSSKIPFPTSDDPNNLLCLLNNGGEEYLEVERKIAQNSNYLK